MRFILIILSFLITTSACAENIYVWGQNPEGKTRYVATGDTMYINSSLATTMNRYPTSFTLKASDSTVICSGKSVTITLPQASTCRGRIYNIKNCATDSTVLISPSGSDIIDGKTSLTLGSRFDGVSLQADNLSNQWYVYGTYKVAPTAHGCYSSTATQTMGGGDTPQILTFNTDEATDLGIYHNTSVLPGRFTIRNPGTYSIIFSGVCDSTGGVNKYINVWMRVNGVDVPRSSTVVRIASASVEMTVAVAFQYDFKVGDYFELWTAGSDNTVRWLYTAAPGAGPECPSLIMTCNKVSD